MKQPSTACAPASLCCFMFPGKLYKQGDWIKQPLLASYLQHVAQNGTAFVYNGTWAKDMVDLVQVGPMWLCCPTLRAIDTDIGDSHRTGTKRQHHG